MNRATRILLISFTLLTSACVTYPQRYGYYPGNSAYSSGYNITHRNHYGERLDHYDNGYRPRNPYYSNPGRHNQPYAQPRWGNNYSEHRHHHDRD